MTGILTIALELLIFPAAIAYTIFTARRVSKTETEQWDQFVAAMKESEPSRR